MYAARGRAGSAGRGRACRVRSVTRAAVTCDDAGSQRALRNISIPAAPIDRRSADAHHYNSVSRANLILDFYVTVACVVFLFIFYFVTRPWIFRLSRTLSEEFRGWLKFDIIVLLYG